MNKKTILITKNDIPNVNLNGKNIIITGATAGIGKETARRLAKMGGNIIFATRNKEKTLNTIADIPILILCSLKRSFFKSPKSIENSHINIRITSTKRPLEQLLNSWRIPRPLK